MSFIIQNETNQRQNYATSSSSIVASGNFMDPERPSSLGVEDRSRFRPLSFVAPQNIELMQGAFTLPGANDIPTPQARPVKSQYGWYMSE